MTEEEVSVELFRAATADSEIEVLSWQSVDGKNYFAFDVKLRLPSGERVEPDLVLRSGTLWLIEVKGTHSEALADETKLVRLLDELGADEVRSQVYRRAGVLRDDGAAIELAVAFGADDVVDTEHCQDGVRHIDWIAVEPQVNQEGLAAVLHAISSDETAGRDPG